MAYHNTTIWMAMMLVIIKLSSTVATDDEEACLKQRLLDEVEYGSSSAEPTDDEKAFLKQRLLDEFDYGSSRTEPTDNKEELFKKEKNYLQALNRGDFSNLRIHIIELDEIDKIRDTLFNNINELDCNYTYDMLVFMKLMTPENYTNKQLYEKVDYACSNWAQHMLNARINSGFPLRKSPYTLWMFHLYTKKMKTFAKFDAKREMNNLRGYVESHFIEQMEKCKYFWPKYDSYKDELTSLNQTLALQIIIEACTHLSMMSESKPHLNFDLDSSLYIKNVVEDDIIMNNLVTSFGGLNEGKEIVRILKNSMNAAKNPMASLSDWINSLGDVNYDFLWIVKTIMLRIWWAFLKNLKRMKNSETAEQVKKILYKHHLNDFANLFQLNEDGEFMELIQSYKKKDCDKLVNNILNDFAWYKKKRRTEIMCILYKFDEKKSFKSYKNNTLNSVNCQTSTLMNITNDIGYKIDILSSIRERILCAEVFVQYLKKKLSGVNFKILQSFVEFDFEVRHNTFIW